MPYTDKPQTVLREIDASKKPFPIYILMGDESYFTDRIEQKLVGTYLPDEATHDFNFSLLYGSEVEVSNVLSASLRPPMGAERTITVVREAQDLFLSSRGSKKEGQTPLDGLMPLVQHPSPYNILILCFKGKSPARTLKAIKAIEKVGLVVSSPAISEYNIQDYIPGMAAEFGLVLQMDAVRTVKEHLGNDVGRIHSEFEKLATALSPEDRSGVTSQMVLKFTALNKEYSPFDLKNALVMKDKARSMKIARALSVEAKRVPVQVIIPVLFNYFSNLLIAAYLPSNDPTLIANRLELKYPRQAQEYVNGLKRYTKTKMVHIISYLRKMDARSKGMYSDEGTPEEILTDLVLMILN